MNSRIRFLLNRLGERLWVRPLAFCVLSVGGAFLAAAADRAGVAHYVPEIAPDSIETLLAIMSSSMLVIATFAVASMVSAYASAASTATPRSFPLIVSDDVSQNALSVFIGAFIFSIVALVALKNGYYEKAGHFALFFLTLTVFAWVVLTFVRWVDKIARLGRLGNTVEKAERAAAAAVRRRRRHPNLGGAPVDAAGPRGRPFYSDRIGYVQHVDVEALQNCAEAASRQIRVAAVPGTFVAPDRPLGYVGDGDSGTDMDMDKLANAFEIGKDRVFEDDPRFGLVVLAEIACRALSPAVNDPGTAIDVLGTFLRLFSAWSESVDSDDGHETPCPRVGVPELSVDDLFDDAFTALSRDGAGAIEVQIRLQKTLAAIAALDDGAFAVPARRHARLALQRAEHAMAMADDIQRIRSAAAWAAAPESGERR